MADAVGIEPVSYPNSLRVIPMICSKIPYAVEQGIFLSGTGKWNCRTGNCSRPIRQFGNSNSGVHDRRVFCVSGFRSRTPHIVAEWRDGRARAFVSNMPSITPSNRVSSNQSLRCRETEFLGQRQSGRNGCEGSRTPLQRQNLAKQPAHSGRIAATAQQGRASGAGGTIRLASRLGGQLPSHAGTARRWRP